ncbi:MAG: hypothetical protein HZA01_04585 [Nitrospinae bacterium]|nr:hypothetical protein [Nitrospinota bacterium]
MKKPAAIILFFTFFLFNGPCFAVEPAPRISDREIIESLAEIKTEIKAIKHEFAIQFEQVNKRFEQVDKRFEQVDKRFEQVDKQFEQVNKRIDDLRADMNTKFEDANAVNRMFFGYTMSVLLALFGYIIWDRRTLMKPLEDKILSIEREFDIGGSDGSKITRLINALRELSKEDEKVAGVLKRFHLL